MCQKNVFGLQIAVNDTLALEKDKGAENLLGKSSNEDQWETLEVVGFDELVEVDTEQLS
jgi:hypothetical protein